MTREDIKACCKKISPGFDEYSECDFADNVQTLAFIDTSQGQNGSRGIVFSTNHMMLNTDGALRIIFYTNITEVRIIESYEDVFSDELEIVCAGEEFRVSNCSLNKAELKSLLDKLCGGGLRGEGPARITPPPPKPPANTIAVTATPPASAPEPKPEQKKEEKPETKPSGAVKNDPGNDGEIKKDRLTVRERLSELEKNEVPQNAPERETHSGEITEKQNVEEENTEEQRANDEDIVIESDYPVIFETVIDRKNVSEKEDDDINNTEERLRIQNMTVEETMSFLAQSLLEINAPVSGGEDDEPFFEQKPAKPEIKTELILETKPKAKQVPEVRGTPEPRQTPEPQQPVQAPEPNQKPGLTVEPVWGDIYIKASRNLRELCESNKLSMKAIETELHDKLLESTKAFAEITSDEARVPKVLIPKITELKAAAQNFEQYFQLGEDIAVRAMFFMLYQMLSYSDRIVETPETKEGLNDFFRRFGPAGIMLSMLDMRV